MTGLPVEERKEGLPAWVMTFADLMTLLMCFYVLMLSFSEMDVAKFKQLSGSMREAFGVQAEIEARVVPKGTSIIAREFSPAQPKSTALNSVRQFTVNSSLNSLDVGREAARLQERAAQEERAERDAQRLRDALLDEILEDKLIVRREGTQVIIQILEKDSFASGRAAIERDYLPTLGRIGSLLAPMQGAITVSGHTDNVPIYTSQYRSNWELSAARAASVVHELLSAGIEPDRIMISGHADTQPRAENVTEEQRALNRRIDIAFITSKQRHGGWNGAGLAETAP